MATQAEMQSAFEAALQPVLALLQQNNANTRATARNSGGLQNTPSILPGGLPGVGLGSAAQAFFGRQRAGALGLGVPAAASGAGAVAASVAGGVAGAVALGALKRIGAAAYSTAKTHFLYNVTEGSRKVDIISKIREMLPVIGEGNMRFESAFQRAGGRLQGITSLAARGNARISEGFLDSVGRFLAREELLAEANSIDVEERMANLTTEGRIMFFRKQETMAQLRSAQFRETGNWLLRRGLGGK